jgi:hypothetical protein
VVPYPVGVAKEENEGMEMDFAARAEEKRDSTEEMRREMCLSFVERVVFEEVKEGVGVGVAEDSVDEVDVRNDEVEDSVDESEEDDDDDEERAEELVVETKELVGSVEEVVRDEEVLSWPAEDELARLEGAWVEEITELLEADEDEEITEELEEDAATVELERIEELDETAEEERVWDAEDEETVLELAFDDEEGLWILNWDAIEASLEETLDSTLEILDWTLEAFAGIWIVVGTAFEEEETAFDDDEETTFDDDKEDLWAVAWEAAEASLEETFDSTLEILDWMLDIFAGIFEVAGTAFTEEDEVFLAELVDEVLTDEDDLVELLLAEELLLEEVIFALDLLEEEDFFDTTEVAKNSGRTMTTPPTRVVGATKRAGARSTRLTSTVLMLRGAATAALARRETRATWLMGVSKRMIGDITGWRWLKCIKKVVWSSEWNKSRRWNPQIFEESCAELLLKLQKNEQDMDVISSTQGYSAQKGLQSRESSRPPAPLPDR